MRLRPQNLLSNILAACYYRNCRVPELRFALASLVRCVVLQNHAYHLVPDYIVCEENGDVNPKQSTGPH